MKIHSLLIRLFGAALIATGSMLLADNGPTFAGVSLNRPTLNGEVVGDFSVQNGQGFWLNGGATISEELWLAGTPTIRFNGQPPFTPVRDADGPEQPSNYQVGVNSGVDIGGIVRRGPVIAFPSSPRPESPQGNRWLNVNRPSDSIGDPSTIRSLTLNSNAGTVLLPAGAYDQLTVNSKSVLQLGTAGATDPEVYHVRRINLNSSGQLRLLGPVLIYLHSDINLNSQTVMGEAAHPAWMDLRIFQGSANLNSSARFYGQMVSPQGTIRINSNVEFHGVAYAKQITINGNGKLIYAEVGDIEAPVEPPLVEFVTVPPALTNDATPALIAAATDASGPLIAATAIFRANGSLVPALAENETFTADWATSLADGDYTVTFAVEGESGDTATISTAFTVDATPPSLVLLSPDDSAEVVAEAFAVVYNVEDLGSGLASDLFTATVNDTEALITVDGTTVTVEALEVLSPGPVTVTFSTSDLAGNTATITNGFTIVLPPPPVLAIAIQPPDFTSETMPAIAFALTPDSGPLVVGSERFLINGAEVAAVFDPLNETYSPVLAEPLADGSYSTIFEVTGRSGDVASLAVDFVVDATAPVVTLVSPPADSEVKPDTFAVAFTVLDETAGVEPNAITATFNGVPGVIGSEGTNLTATPAEALPEGLATVTLGATDRAGNLTALTVSYQVIVARALEVEFAAVPPPFTNVTTPEIIIQPTADSGELDPATARLVANGVEVPLAQDGDTFRARWQLRPLLRNRRS